MGIVGGALALGGAVLGAKSARDQSKAAQNAANTQAASADRASQVQKEMYDQTRSDLMPYANAGKNSLAQLMGQMAPDGYFNQTYTGQDIYSDPSYQFRLQQGQDAVQSGAAAQGGLLSGATLKALQGYGQDMASQEFSNAYNRFNADQTNQYNRLSNLVGIGQNAAAQQGNAGAQTAQAIANNTMAGANAQAAGQIAAGNRSANTFGNLLGVGSAFANYYNQSGKPII
ncbi:DNA transfer protein p32 [Acinetobacter junii]|uniref:DNA transfer protein p32 n=1 Tax=Acinetobacter junii TaxID=40215 RepID=UPI0021D3B9B3|nr:DNA transfer protein p32 [Acinetobacter junii]